MGKICHYSLDIKAQINPNLFNEHNEVVISPDVIA
ncbi:hypothetical protein AsAng_0059290 [Aureispira anguillae]|uniref:Uncharacterized protein n=1 Tax=Aureispira anguillae TaxID=2864201 RepID=A0A916DWW6_9BACT|nr:hypothetical protein AsAng_0059290 [Aureispira anguillae]